MSAVEIALAAVLLVMTGLAGWAYVRDRRDWVMLAAAGLFLGVAVALVATAGNPRLVYWVWWVPVAGAVAMGWLKRHDRSSPIPK